MKNRSILSTSIASLLPRIARSTGYLALLTAGISGVHAQTWNGGGADDNWGTGANWVGGVAPATGTGTTINFAGSTRLTPNYNYTAYDQQGSIFFNSGASAFTLGGTDIKIFTKIENSSTALQTVNFASLVLNGTTATEINPVSGNLVISSPVVLDTPQLRIFGNNGNTVTFNGAISTGSATLPSVSINQNSNVVYGAANTYTGDTFINAGSLLFAQGGSANNSTIRLGDTTGAVAATLSITDLDGGTTVGSVLNVRTGSSGVKTIAGTNTSGTNTFAGVVAYDAAATVSSNNAGGTLAFTGATFELKTFAGTFTGSGDTTISNIISSTSTAGTLTKTGTGVLTLSGANTYTGTTAVSAGILRLAGGAAIANAGLVSTVAGGLLDLNGTTETIGSLSGSVGSVNLGAGALTLSDNNASSITGLVYGTGGTLVKQGTNTLTLGTLQGSTNSFSSGNLFSGGLSIASGSGLTTISTANASGTGLITTASSLTISAQQLLLSGGITINGGTTTLSQTNAAGTGTVTLNTGGTLAITSTSAAQLASVVLSNGTFTPAASMTFGSLAGSVGFTAAAGTLTFGTNNTASATYSGNIAGAVASNLTKTGSGTQILNGTNATTGTITTNGSGGTLEIGGQFAGNAGVVGVNAGTLRLNFNTGATTTNLLNSASTLTLGGGTLSIQGKNSATNSIQSFAGLTTTAGTSSTISVINGSSTGTTALDIGALTSRGAGSAVNFNIPTGTQTATNGILTSAGTAGAILRASNNQAFATVNGTSFAAKDATTNNIVALASNFTATSSSVGTNNTQNTDVNGVSAAGITTATINTLRFSDSAARTVGIATGQTLTLNSGGILVSSAVTSAGSGISGGSITAGATPAELIIHQFSNQPFTLDSVVTGAVALVKTGPGTLIVTRVNTNGVSNVGAYVASGTLQLGAGGGFTNGAVSLSPNDPTAVFDVNNQTASIANLSGGNATGGYTNLGSTGNLSIIGGFGSFTNGALVGGVDSVLNKTTNAGNQGFQGSSNAAFYGTANVTTGSLGFFAGGSSLINGRLVVGASGSINMGGTGASLTFGSISGSGTLGGASGASSNGSYSVGYLGSDTTFSGTIVNGSNATPGTTGLTKFGSGTTILSGANTYSGVTQINSGGLTFDYATNTALPTTSALSVGGGTATFLGKSSGATTISTGTFGFNNSVLSRVTVNSNGGTGTTLTLKTAVVNGVNTLGASSANGSLLFDISSSASNVLQTDLAIGASDNTNATVAIRTQNGLLTTGLGNVATPTLNNYRADVLIRDSTGIGFAQASGTTISRFLTSSATALPSGNTAMLDTTNYRVSNTSVTRTAVVLYNTIELDSSTAAASLTANFDTFTRFGNGSASVSGRGVLATGSNGATITSGGGTNQATYFNNYQTGTTAGQTLTLNMDLAGISVFNGTGLTVATRLVSASDQLFQSGVTRLTGAQNSGDALTAGGGVYRLVGGILEIGADLTGSASPTSTADFSRSVGGGAGQVSLLGDTGFSASGANRTVNLGGNGQQLLWGNDNFLASTAGSTTEGNNTFRLSSAFSDSRIDFQNAIALGNITRQVDVANGTAAVDARLSGVLSGVFAPTVTLGNAAPAISNAAAGLTKLGAGTLELTAANTYTGRTTVSAGTLIANGANTLGGTSDVVVSTGGTLILDGSGTNRVNNAASVRLAGGTLDLNGKSEGAAGTTGIGTLTLTVNSTIDFGASTNENNIIQFAGLGTHTSGTILSIVDWNGIPNTGGSQERLLFSGTASSFTSLYAQSEVSFNGILGYNAINDIGGSFFEVTAVPEPSTYIGGGLILGLAAFSQRRRLFSRSTVA